MNSEEVFDSIKYVFENEVILQEALHGELWRQLHYLAEQSFEPLLPLLAASLDSNDWSVRQEALALLGFHYNIGENIDLISRISEMLLHDEGGDGQVRMTAASVLGAQLDEVSSEMLIALNKEEDNMVSSSIFRAILHISGLSYGKIESIMQLVESGGIDANVTEVKKIPVSLQDRLIVSFQIANQSPENRSIDLP